MLRTLAPGRLGARWFLLAALSVILAGAVLWAVTGSWQWMITMVSAVLCAPNLYHAATREDLARAAASVELLRKFPPTTRTERLADGLGILFLVVSVNYALWVGPWWWGAVGAGVWIAVAFGTSMRADIRLERRLDRARSRFDEAGALADDNRFKEAAAVFDQVIVELGDDPLQRTRNMVALALYSKALSLMKANKRRDAVEAYMHLIDEYRDDPTPEVQKVVKRAGEVVGRET